MTVRLRRDTIDNLTDYITMQDVLNFEIPKTERLDISTGYFNVNGYSLLRGTLEQASYKDDFHMRLLLGRQALIPEEGTFEELAQKYNEDALSIKSSLDDADLTSDTLSDTISLISLLRRENIQVKLGRSRPCPKISLA